MAAQDSVLVQIARPYAQALFDLAQSENALGAVEQGLEAVARLKSLFDLAQSENALGAVEQGLEAVARLTGESQDFARFLSSPVIGADLKATALDKIIADAKPNATVANFLRVVARNGRLFVLPIMIKAYRELAAGARGEIAADVTSATPLSAAQLKNLADTLKAKVGKQITLIEHVDPSLIGGLVVKVGSQMIDSSLKTKLTAMQVAMKEVG